jgi:hypothetical protein
MIITQNTALYYEFRYFLLQDLTAILNCQQKA